MRSPRSFFVLVALLTAGTAAANNIQVSNVQLLGQNTTDHTYQVQFDLTWENSWRTSTVEANWDAAWVFIKCAKQDVRLWSHAHLALAGAVAPGGCTVAVAPNADAPSVGVGAFIYRSTDGNGTATFTGVQLRWNYGADGFSDSDPVDISVQAIEMVYVPQGAFYLGDGAGGDMAGFETDTTSAPFRVTTDSAPLTLGGPVPGSLGNNNRVGQPSGRRDDFTDAVSVTLPATFPLGFTAYYVMKYEISHAQYMEFLNKLTTEQAAYRFYGTVNNGHSAFVNGTRFETAAPARALNYLSWPDVAAYLDWAALRPLSETEYEKACRGTRYAVAGEFAWGNAGIQGNMYPVVEAPDAEDAVFALTGQHVGNAWYNSVRSGVGTVRCGIFAASSTHHTREETGASYYGIMELSGNVTEHYVSVGSASGRAFTGTHGDGALTTTGTADAASWPSSVDGAGVGLRSGGWADAVSLLRTSNRVHANNSITAHDSGVGGRGGRTAP